MKKLLVILFFSLSSSLFTFCGAQITNLHSFTNNEYPYGSLTLSGNVLYGMTFEGGANSEGYVFSMNTNGTGFEDLWDFDDTGSNGNANGRSPYGAVIYSNGKLYGMTYYGGANNMGVIFSINSNGGGYKDLWDFDDTGVNGHANGAYPYGSLTYANGVLFGFTFDGGANNEGIIFSIDTNGRYYKDIYDFNSVSGGTNPYYSALAMSVSQKVLYGVTYVEGLYGYGTVYSIDTDGSRFTDLLDFDITNGEAVYNSVQLSGNLLLGMTYEGGSTSFQDGTVYTIDTDGTYYKDIFNFNSTNGARPFGDVTISGSELYGLTYDGGIYLQGNLFTIDSNGSGFSDLYDFNTTNDNGAFPFANLTLSGDTLYGMTQDGGTDGYGNIFSFVDTAISTGIIKLNLANNINVYPNPNNGIFTVTLSHPLTGGYQTIEIYNALGQQVYSTFLPQTPKGALNEINIVNQPNGIYLYRVIANSGELMGEGKVIIQK